MRFSPTGQDFAEVSDRAVSYYLFLRPVPSSFVLSFDRKHGYAEQVIPSLSGLLTGMAFRVPTANVSVVDLTCIPDP
jgi:hypothetical protein